MRKLALGIALSTASLAPGASGALPPAVWTPGGIIDVGGVRLESTVDWLPKEAPVVHVVARFPERSKLSLRLLAPQLVCKVPGRKRFDERSGDIIQSPESSRDLSASLGRQAVRLWSEVNRWQHFHLVLGSETEVSSCVISGRLALSNGVTRDFTLRVPGVTTGFREIQGREPQLKDLSVESYLDYDFLFSDGTWTSQRDLVTRVRNTGKIAVPITLATPELRCGKVFAMQTQEFGKSFGYVSNLAAGARIVAPGEWVTFRTGFVLREWRSIGDCTARIRAYVVSSFVGISVPLGSREFLVELPRPKALPKYDF